MSLTNLNTCVKSLCETAWTSEHMPKVVQADTNFALFGMLILDVVRVKKVTNMVDYYLKK